MHYIGLVQQTARFAEAAEADEPRGRLLGTGHIEYQVYRVT
jgi:hypothetical protein